MSSTNQNSVKTNKESQSFYKQLISIFPTLIWSGVLAVSGFLLTIWVSFLTTTPVWKLTKDAADVASYPPYFGMLSSWSSMLWMATASICLFTAILLWKDTPNRATRRFLFFSGILTLMIAIDDLYLLHDRILPRTFHISEGVFYLIYLFIIIGYLVFFLKQIMQFDYIIFFISFFLLSFSRSFYKLIPFLREFGTANDILKYFGIVFWLAFFTRAAAKQLRR